MAEKNASALTGGRLRHKLMGTPGVKEGAIATKRGEWARRGPINTAQEGWGCLVHMYTEVSARLFLDTDNDVGSCGTGKRGSTSLGRLGAHTRIIRSGERPR